MFWAQTEGKYIYLDDIILSYLLLKVGNIDMK